MGVNSFDVNNAGGVAVTGVQYWRRRSENVNKVLEQIREIHNFSIQVGGKKFCSVCVGEAFPCPTLRMINAAGSKERN